MGGHQFKDLFRRTLCNIPAGAKPYCLLPFSYSLINSGGQVLPCPHCPGEPPAGVITPESPFSKVWLGESLMKLRKRILDNDPPPMCQKCSTRIMIDPDNYEYFQPYLP
jgi:MoaA/NifB/PqqE/SkfB family radical SAM enzyme